MKKDHKRLIMRVLDKINNKTPQDWEAMEEIENIPPHLSAHVASRLSEHVSEVMRSRNNVPKWRNLDQFAAVQAAIDELAGITASQ